MRAGVQIYQISIKRRSILIKIDQKRSKPSAFCLAHLTKTGPKVPWRYREGTFTPPKTPKNRQEPPESASFVYSNYYQQLAAGGAVFRNTPRARSL